MQSRGTQFPAGEVMTHLPLHRCAVQVTTHPLGIMKHRYSCRFQRKQFQGSLARWNLMTLIVLALTNVAYGIGPAPATIEITNSGWSGSDNINMSSYKTLANVALNGTYRPERFGRPNSKPVYTRYAKGGQCLTHAKNLLVPCKNPSKVYPTGNCRCGTMWDDDYWIDYDNRTGRWHISNAFCILYAAPSRCSCDLGYVDCTWKECTLGTTSRWFGIRWHNHQCKRECSVCSVPPAEGWKHVARECRGKSPPKLKFQ